MHFLGIRVIELALAQLAVETNHFTCGKRRLIFIKQVVEIVTNKV